MNRPAILIYDFDGCEGDPDAALRAAEGPMAYAAAFVPDSRPGTSWIATGRSKAEAVGKLNAMWERQYPARDRSKGPRKPTSEPVVCVADDDIVI